jgi:uncharacterized Zn-finger protein
MNNIESERGLVVTNAFVNCNGGSSLSGHPSVYLNVGSKGKISCPYCSQVFILASGNVDKSSH